MYQQSRILELCSCKSRINTKNPKSAEAWHNHIYQVINKRQLGFYVLLSELIKDIVVIESDIDKMTIGSPSKVRRKKHTQKEERIKKLLEIKGNLKRRKNKKVV